MKLPIPCIKCGLNGTHHSEITTIVEINDEGIYKIQCKNDHTFFVILQQQKFEVLFQIGFNAINDGYYREAVSSFTSALERFYEFFIRTICLSKGIDQVSIDNSWRLMSSQSERQLGAFIFLHVLEMGIPPTLLNAKKIQFRNEVIHKGKIPTKEEAIEYGQEVLNLIRPLMIMLVNKHAEAVDKMLHLYQLNARKKSPEGSDIQTMWITTILSISNMNQLGFDEVNLTELLLLS